MKNGQKCRGVEVSDLGRTKISLNNLFLFFSCYPDFVENLLFLVVAHFSQTALLVRLTRRKLVQTSQMHPMYLKLWREASIIPVDRSRVFCHHTPDRHGWNAQWADTQAGALHRDTCRIGCILEDNTSTIQ